MIRVGIVDDHPMVLWGIERALSDFASMTVSATALSPDALNLDEIDVLLLDVYLDGDTPSTAVVAELTPRTKIVLMSATRCTEDIDAGIRAGASGFLHKSSPREEIARMICAVGGGATETLQHQPESADNAHGLSPREQQVIVMIGGGLTHDQTARRLGVSKHTVDTYIKRVRAKHKLGNKAELARLAHQLNSPATATVWGTGCYE